MKQTNIEKLYEVASKHHGVMDRKAFMQGASAMFSAIIYNLDALSAEDAHALLSTLVGELANELRDENRETRH